MRVLLLVVLSSATSPIGESGGVLALLLSSLPWSRQCSRWVGIVACWVPAIRAIRIGPAIALRDE